MTPSVTLHDVANAAGVHPSTVSRTLSRPELVNAQTRTAVEEAVALLGYVPNRAARRLAGGSTATIAVLVPDVTNPFFSAIVRGIQQAAAPSGRIVVLSDTGGSSPEEVAVVRSLATEVDGFIACAPVASTKDWTQMARGRPIVFVSRRARSVSSVVVDQGSINALAVAHLRGLGHRRIAVLSGPSSYWSSAERARRIGDLDDGPEPLLRIGPVAPTVEGGREALDRVTESGVTGVVAFNDLMALGLMSAATDAGIGVPGALSIVGSDDVPFSTLVRPALTTVAAPLHELGAEALDTLDALLARRTPVDVTLEPSLAVRGSTAPPP